MMKTLFVVRCFIIVKSILLNMTCVISAQGKSAAPYEQRFFVNEAFYFSLL